MLASTIATATAEAETAARSLCARRPSGDSRESTCGLSFVVSLSPPLFGNYHIMAPGHLCPDLARAPVCVCVCVSERKVRLRSATSATRARLASQHSAPINYSLGQCARVSVANSAAVASPWPRLAFLFVSIALRVERNLRAAVRLVRISRQWLRTYQADERERAAPASF